jgi:hypothetical protein
MTSAQQLEYFCTLFDSHYLPQGLSLHASLMQHAQPFHLSILCMDAQVEQQLLQLALPHVTLIPLNTVETPELLAVKSGRTRGEYCWTLTPFSFSAALSHHPQSLRITYLDADLFFFDDPRILLAEMEEANKQVLITEHAYDPKYDQSSLSGRFCVQFLTFNNTQPAQEIMHWWQARCLEWCFDKLEPDRFGDQKYLDQWPMLFGDRIHICQQTEKTLAPWNLRYFLQQYPDALTPVFYHFHALKLMAPNQIRLHYRYVIPKVGLVFYWAYYDTLIAQLKRILDFGWNIPLSTQTKLNFLDQLKKIKQSLFHETRYIPIILESK